MPRRLLVIGIGVGDPDWITVQAVNALNRVDVFFVLDKGPATADLVEARRSLCARLIGDDRYRFVEVPDPPRDRTTPAYAAAVEDWRDARAAALEQVVASELDDDGVGGFLVWGDPSLYDGTLRVIETIMARGTLELEYEVIPGVSTIHALAARHRITLNRVAAPVHVTTGRRLVEGLPNGVDDIVVMLDADLACRALASDGDIDIYWGAYLGTEDEILVSGRLREVIDDIARMRREARERKGWIMDSYLLRRNPDPG
jgi:precorrin-6A synthase